MLSPTLSQRYIRNQSLVTKYRLFSIQNAFEIAHLPSLINCLKAQCRPWHTALSMACMRLFCAGSCQTRLWGGSDKQPPAQAACAPLRKLRKCQRAAAVAVLLQKHIHLMEILYLMVNSDRFLCRRSFRIIPAGKDPCVVSSPDVTCQGVPYDHYF